MSASWIVLLMAGAAPPQPSNLDAKKPEEIRRLLKSPHPECERGLAILWRQPRKEKPPAAPAVADERLRMTVYPELYTRWAGLPREVKTGDGLVLVLVPPGTFRMGSPAKEKGRSADEEQVTVTLTRPVYVGKHEVTVGQFRRFVEQTGFVTDGERGDGGGHAHDEKAVWKHRTGTSWRKPGFAGKYVQRDDHPVVHVSYEDAMAYCHWATRRGGGHLRYDLPTEAQWEWACRAGSGERFWWGDDADEFGRSANVGDKALKTMHPDWPRTIVAKDDKHAFVAPVGSYRANPWGLHDMLGNVWEWCSTKAGPYPRGPVTDPGDLDPKRGYAVRGGGWSNEVKDCRCATRNADPPRFRHSNLGFRVVLVLP